MKRYFRIKFLFLPMVLSIFLFGNLHNVYSKDYSWGYADVRSTTNYQYQWSDTPNGKLTNHDSDDTDIYEIIDAELGNRSKGWSFSFLGKYAKDLDGTREGSIFQDYLDSSNSDRQRFDVYYAYLEKKDIVKNVDIRLGRQYAYGAESVHFNGAWVRMNKVLGNWLSVEAFGGSVVQMYSDLTRDGVGGLNFEIKPVKNLLINLDSVFYKDNSFQASIYWMPTDILKVRTMWSLINSKSKDLSFDIMGTCPYSKTTIRFNLYKRFSLRESDDFIYDYTYSVKETVSKDLKRFYLGKQRDYWQGTLSISQPIPHLEGLSVYVNYTLRQLTRDKDETLYNTNFRRYTIGMNMENFWVLKGSHINFGYSYWKENNRYIYEEESYSIFGNISQEIGEHLELSAGFYYKSEDVNHLVENETARHYFGRVNYEINEMFSASLEYEYENDDFYKEFGVDSINTLTATIHIKW